ENGDGLAHGKILFWDRAGVIRTPASSERRDRPGDPDMGEDFFRAKSAQRIAAACACSLSNDISRSASAPARSSSRSRTAPMRETWLAADSASPVPLWKRYQ